MYGRKNVQWYSILAMANKNVQITWKCSGRNVRARNGCGTCRTVNKSRAIFVTINKFIIVTILDTRNKLSPISIQPPNVRFLRLLDKRFIQSLVIYPIQLTLYCLYSFRTRTASRTFLCKRKTHSNRLLDRYISDVSYEIYNTLRLWVKVTYGPY